jgi:hypothetical protein
VAIQSFDRAIDKLDIAPVTLPNEIEGFSDSIHNSSIPIQKP